MWSSNMSKTQFGMGLRVGCVKVQEIYDQGGILEVAKHELSDSKCIAIFRGGGLSIAEDLIKGNEDEYEIENRNSPSATLSGLTCNWQPLENKRGQIMSLLLLSQVDDPKVYQEFLQKLDELYNGDLTSGNPVNIEKLKMKSLFDLIKSNTKRATKYFNMRFINRDKIFNFFR